MSLSEASKNGCYGETPWYYIIKSSNRACLPANVVSRPAQPRAREGIYVESLAKLEEGDRKLRLLTFYKDTAKIGNFPMTRQLNPEPKAN